MGWVVDLWILGRVRMLPFVLGLPGIGFALAHWDRALPLTGVERLPWLALAWMLLHLGTLWLNAAVDRDHGPVLFGAPARVPRWLGPLGVCTLLLAPVCAMPAGLQVAACAALCSGLAVLYSAPGMLWKAHPVGGPVVNLLGYGIVSPLAGWAVCDVPMSPRLATLLVLVACSVMGAYFAAQAFQEHEDRERGYRTLVATHGPSRTLEVASVFLTVALVGLMALAVVGWLPRVLLLGAPMLVWVHRWMVGWWARSNQGTERDARELIRRLVWVGVALVGLAFLEYVRASLAGELVAGLGTVRGHPPDLTPFS